MKIVLIFFLLLLNSYLFSQEDDSLRVSVSHVVIDPSLINPYTTVETYIEVKDSIDMFIENMQKQFGDIEEENGVFVWQGISIDSIGNNLKILMYHGVWSNKNESNTFQTIPIQKFKNIKKNEKRGLKIRVYLKNGKDALTSKKYEIVITSILEAILNTPPEEMKSEEVTPTEVNPEVAKPEEVIPEEVKPEEVIPEEAKPEEIKSEEAIPEEKSSEEVNPEKVNPEEVKPEEEKPEEVTPEEEKSEEPNQEEVIPEESKPEKGKTKKVKTKKIKPEEVKEK